MTGTASETTDRLPLSVCLGFGIGTVGVSIMLNGVTAYFPAYMSTVLGKSPQIAGYLLMASKLYDAFADVAIGMLSDRTRSRWGRRRPYLLFGGLFSALSFLMIFTPPAIGDNAVSLYMFAALVLYSTGYSLFNVPYMAMPSEMTASRYERSRLLSFRTLFVSIGQLLALAGTASLISWGGGGAHGYAIMAYVMGLVIVSAMVASFFGTAKAPHLEVRAKPESVFGKSRKSDFQSLFRPAPPAQPPTGYHKWVVGPGERDGTGFLQTDSEQHIEMGQLAWLWRNRPFVLLLSAKIFQFLSFASVATTSLLFMLNVLRIGYIGQMQLAITQNLVVAASMPVWLAIERRLGKRNAYLVGIAGMCLYSLSWIAADKDITVTGIIVRGLLSGFSSGGMILLSISMLADTLAYDREQTGLRREGLLSSVAAVIEKTSYALGVAVVGAFLAMAHYIPTRNGQIVQQPASAVHALYICYSLLPLALFACNALCIWFYTLGGRSSVPVAVIDDSLAAPGRKA